MGSKLPTAVHKKSNENQSAGDVCYRFGEFELHPDDRLLKRSGEPVAMPPKAFDALLMFARQSERLVRKSDLMDSLWPDTFVNEANLTNIVGVLRKVLGAGSIRTVSKHGYRFSMPVHGEPGVARTTYETFVRARELTEERSLASMARAREMYWLCLAEDPTFATAWAWLGRCCWFMAKFGEQPSANADLALASFRRAFALDPDLASAHQFYTPIQLDTGAGLEALTRLLERAQRRPADPETFAGLVQVLRFCGLLEESVAAHMTAVELDPALKTGVAHTLFLAGEYQAAIEMYRGKTGYYLDAAAWAALGDTSRAKTLLRSRLEAGSLSPMIGGMMRSLLAVLEERTELAEVHLDNVASDPEVLVYTARHYARAALSNEAILLLGRAMDAGFACAPSTLENDPWLSTVRSHPGFPAVLDRARTLVQRARATYTRARPPLV